MSVYFLGKSRKPQSFKTTEQKKKSVKNCCALEKFGKLFCSIENAMDSESTFCDCCELRKGCIIWSYRPGFLIPAMQLHLCLYVLQGTSTSNY
uniref:Uncharacterized protein n=1 Tax=Megaselia scalaris TaxID=36166 RepID=T1GH73_MEGSC